MSEATVKYAYQKLMAENNLTVKDLPEDAKIGITAIMNIEKAVNMAEKKNKKVSPDTIAKIKANDKWVCNEILDFLDSKEGVEDGDRNEEDELPHDAEEVVEEIKETVEEQEEEEEEEEAEEGKSGDDKPAENKSTIADQKAKELGLAIEAELAEMHSSGKVDWHSDEIKAKYKNTYNTLFDNYVDGEENGIVTTNYKLIEKSEEVFTISKT